jgi:hypothetical protein
MKISCKAKRLNKLKHIFRQINNTKMKNSERYMGTGSLKEITQSI